MKMEEALKAYLAERSDEELGQAVLDAAAGMEPAQLGGQMRLLFQIGGEEVLTSVRDTLQVAQLLGLHRSLEPCD